MGNGIPVKNVSYEAEGMKILSLNGAESILIRSFEVNRKSDSINSYDSYIGLVLYAYDGRSSWRVNGIYCESGFILIKKINNIQRQNSRYWNSTHSKLYKWYFGVDPDYTKIVGAGFAYKSYEKEVKNSEGAVVRTYNTRGLVYNSNTFNAFDRIDKDNFTDSKYAEYKDEYHDTNRSMSVIEQHWVEKAFNAWKENDYSSKKVYCNAATWKFRRHNEWNDYDHSDCVQMEKEYQIYREKKSAADSSEHLRERFEKTDYYFIRRINGTRYSIYFNAPSIESDMYGYESSDGYQRSANGCVRAIYRSSNAYSGGNGMCVIL